MANNGLLAGKRPSNFINLACAVLLVVTAIVYGVNTSAAGSFNATVVVCLVLAAVCAAAFALVDAKVADLGNLVAVGLVAYALATFIINSISILTDMLTGISMFSGGADGSYIIPLAVLMGIALVIEIVSCFMSRDAK